LKKWARGPYVLNGLETGFRQSLYMNADSFWVLDLSLVAFAWYIVPRPRRRGESASLSKVGYKRKLYLCARAFGHTRHQTPAFYPSLLTFASFPITPATSQQDVKWTFARALSARSQRRSLSYTSQRPEGSSSIDPDRIARDGFFRLPSAPDYPPCIAVSPLTGSRTRRSLC
jgi:hypothetical protein